MAITDLSQRCFIDFLQSELLEVANVLFDVRSNLSQEPVNCDSFNLCSSDLQVEDRNSLVVIVRNSLNPDLSGDNNLIEPMRTTLMIASYRWIVSFTLVMGFLAGTLVCAKSTGVQQKIPKRPGNMTVLTIGSHAAGRSYFGKGRQGVKDFVTDHPGDNSLFDIFCSATDTEAFRPGQNSSTTAALGSGSKPGRVTRHWYNLRPC